MATKNTYALRAEELEQAIIEASAELDRADGSRIGLQEAIDAAQSVLREAYGDSYDQDVSAHLEEYNSDDDEDSDDEDSDEDSDDDE